MAASFISADRYLESMLTWQPYNTSATTDQQKGDQDTMVARSRDAWRNQLIAKSIIERLTTNVIGSGLVLKPKIKDNPVLEDQISTRWETWIKKCEYEDTLNFYGLQTLIFSSRLLSGDVFVNTIISGSTLKLQIIEADRISNSMWSPDTRDKIGGVVLKEGVPVAYSVQFTHPGDVFPEFKWAVFPKYGEMSGQQRIFHIWRKERPGQVRGIPILATPLESLRKMDRYMEAELTGAVISNLFSVFVKSEAGMQLPQSSDTTSAAATDAKSDQVFMQPGAVVNLNPGEDISFANPNKPNPNYEAFVNSIIKQIAASVGIPFDVLMMQFNDSYSASRAALMQFWKTVMRYRWEFIEQFCQPIYELWLKNEIISGGILLDKVNPEVFNASWVGPAKGSIDDTKEVAAAKGRIDLGVSDIQTEAEEIGGRDWLDIHQQRSMEQKMRKEAGLEVQAKAPGELPIVGGIENAISK